MTTPHRNWQNHPNSLPWTATPRHVVCAFARSIIAERTNEPVELFSRPHESPRQGSPLEERWVSASRHYVVAHAFIRAIEDDTAESQTFVDLAASLTRALTGRMPGRFHLYLGDGCVAEEQPASALPRIAIEREVLKAVPRMKVGEWLTIHSPFVPCPLELHRAHPGGSSVVVGRRVDSVDARRLARTRNALASTCPLLAYSRSPAPSISVLILESGGRDRANGRLLMDAVLLALSERQDQPDVVLLVEAGATPFHAWVVADRVDLYPAGRTLPQYYDQHGEWS